MTPTQVLIEITGKNNQLFMSVFKQTRWFIQHGQEGLSIDFIHHKRRQLLIHIRACALWLVNFSFPVLWLDSIRDHSQACISSTFYYFLLCHNFDKKYTVDSCGIHVKMVFVFVFLWATETPQEPGTAYNHYIELITVQEPSYGVIFLGFTRKRTNTHQSACVSSVIMPRGRWKTSFRSR